MGGEIENRNKEWKILIIWHDVHVKIFQEQFNLDTKGERRRKDWYYSWDITKRDTETKIGLSGEKIKVFVAQRKFFIQAGQESGASFLSTSGTNGPFIELSSFSNSAAAEPRSQSL